MNLFRVWVEVALAWNVPNIHVVFANVSRADDWTGAFPTASAAAALTAEATSIELEKRGARGRLLASCQLADPPRSLPEWRHCIETPDWSAPPFVAVLFGGRCSTPAWERIEAELVTPRAELDREGLRARFAWGEAELAETHLAGAVAGHE